ncbi:MAG: aminotransferase class III-fold pyridoxal phosphate-dependent enzyme [Parvularculaceae bacterium]
MRRAATGSNRSFLQGIRALCDKNGWLMIADEVLTGLGRTCKMWAVEHYGVVPDILVVGKNLSGGIEACAGVAARDEILGDNPDFPPARPSRERLQARCEWKREIYKRDDVLEHAKEDPARSRAKS